MSLPPKESYERASDYIMDRIRAVGEPVLLGWEPIENAEIRTVEGITNWNDFNENNKTMKYRVTTDHLANLDWGDVIKDRKNGYCIAETHIENKGYPVIEIEVVERNPDWFEPVEEVQEGQYWACIDLDHVVRVCEVKMDKVLLQELSDDSPNSDYDRKDFLVSDYRKLSTDEIEQALAKEVKRREYKVGMRVKSAQFGREAEIGYYKNGGTGYELNGNEDAYYLDGVAVYSKGQWAQIVDQTPDIEINGYKADFHEDYVKFGCATINVGLIKDLHRTIDSHSKNNNALGVNHRHVNEVKIGNGTFTVEELKKIAEHYE